MNQPLPTIAASSCVAKRLEMVELIIAHAPLFVSEVASRDERVLPADPEHARSHIGYLEYRPQLDGDDRYITADWPFCVVAPDVPGGHVAIGTGDAIELLGFGDVAIILADLARPEDNIKDSCLRFLNWAGGVIDEIANLTGRDFAYNNTGPLDRVHPVFTDISLTDSPERSRSDQRAALDYWTMQYSVSMDTGVGG